MQPSQSVVYTRAMKEVPPGSMLPTPQAIEDSDQAQKDFYDLVLSRVRVISLEESEQVFSKAFGKHCIGLAGVLVAHDTDKSVNALDFVLVKSLFTIDGESYEDLIPFVTEHELYEAWLLAKKHIGEPQRGEDRHLAARKREFLFAEAAGKSERLAKWYGLALREIGAGPENLKHYESEISEAVEYAKANPKEVAWTRFEASW